MCDCEEGERFISYGSRRRCTRSPYTKLRVGQQTRGGDEVGSRSTRDAGGDVSAVGLWRSLVIPDFGVLIVWRRCRGF
jgi:hypothetical protein